MKPAILLVASVTGVLFSQTAERIGLFEAESDVGNPAIKGSVAFDPAKKEYRITGSGANIWAKNDEFHFVWLQLSGDVRMTATLHFEGTSPTLHRKAGLMMRKSLETGAPYVDAVVHGNGLTALQVRETADDITRGFDFPVVGPTRIRLERSGNVYTLWQGKEGEPLQEAGSIQCNLGDPVYAGLFISSHNPKLTETAVFSDVTIETGKKSGNKK
jgi:TolB protein